MWKGVITGGKMKTKIITAISIAMEMIVIQMAGIMETRIGMEMKKKNAKEEIHPTIMKTVMETSIGAKEMKPAVALLRWIAMKFAILQAEAEELLIRVPPVTAEEVQPAETDKLHPAILQP